MTNLNCQKIISVILTNLKSATKGTYRILIDKKYKFIYCINFCIFVRK